MSGAPSTVVFCTISKLARLVTTTNPLAGYHVTLSSRSNQLVQRIVPSDVLPDQ